MTNGPVSLWSALRLMPGFSVAEIPRPDVDPGTGEPGQAGDQRQRRIAVLASAFHSGATRPVALGWARSQASGPVEILTGGQVLAGPEETDSGRVSLRLPSGARAEALGLAGLASRFSALSSWVRIAAVHDTLVLDDEGRESQERPSLEEGLLAAWDEPFAWLVLAEPLDPAAIAEMARDVSAEQRHALGRTERSPDYQIRAERLRSRFRELSQAQGTGMWRVHLLAGGVTGQAARAVAGQVCASLDLAGLPYALVPAAKPGTLDAVLDQPAAIELHSGQGDSPFFAGTPMLAALMVPPDREVPGVRFVLRPEFDLTPEGAASGEQADGRGGLRLGTVLDRQRAGAGEVTVTLDSLNRHTFVCGATGGGKSQTIRGILESATSAGIPWLVVEPAKAEYRAMAARLAGSGEVVVIRPGEAGALAAGINPLEPATGPDGARFALQTHLDLVRALFVAAFDSDEPFPQVLSAALTRCYEELGWDLALGEAVNPDLVPRFPTLEDLQRTAEQVVTDIGYGQEIADNVRGFIRVRISSLRLGTTGRFFVGGHHLDFAELLKRNVVFEIEDVGDDHDKAFLMGTVLLRLAEYLRLAHRASPADGLRHLTVVEEAHRLLRHAEGRSGPAAHAVEMFASLLAEIRAYGEGLIIAEQIPAKLIPDAIKNTAVKIVHRLPAADDRETVGATMNLTAAQSAYLVTLPPGQAAVFTDGMDYPLLARMPDGTAREKTPASTAGTAAIVDTRSGTCGASCREEPCTLRQMREAQRRLMSDPLLVVWAELSVLAHLAGTLMPVPRVATLARLRTMDPRLRECAVSHAVDAAVASRNGVFAEYVSPGALASHVTAAMHIRVVDRTWHCVKDETQWQTATPEQRILAYGATRPSAIEKAIGCTAGDPAWRYRLSTTLDEFIQCRWPLRHLTPASGGRSL